MKGNIPPSTALELTYSAELLTTISTISQLRAKAPMNHLHNNTKIEGYSKYETLKYHEC